MHTPGDFIDLLKARHSLPSDYAAAKLIGAKPNQMSDWRSGRQTPSERLCFTIGESLDMDGVYVWACIKAAKSEIPIMRKQWEQAAEKLAANA